MERGGPGTDFDVETAPYGRRVPVRRLPRHPQRTRPGSLGGFFLAATRPDAAQPGSDRGRATTP